MRRNIARQLLLFLALLTAVDAYGAGEHQARRGGTAAAVRHRRPIHAQSGVSTLQTGTPGTDLSGTISGFPSLPMVGGGGDNCNPTEVGCTHPH
jgi:hypothetical protein